MMGIKIHLRFPCTTDLIPKNVQYIFDYKIKLH